MRMKVFRYRDGMLKPRYETYELEPSSGLTVLGALFQIQKNFDDSISFHYSCRGAVCGTCAMFINKVPRLACRTQVAALLDGKLRIPLSPYPAMEETVEWNPEEEVLVEPLPHFPVVRDLIVDMKSFFDYYKFIVPVFKPDEPEPKRERLMDPGAIPELELYTNCILCGACFGSCPVDAKDQDFLGPAALAKLYRFYIDPRDADNSRLETADLPRGWWDCEFHGNCRRVCPKGVPPLIAIAKAREQLDKDKENLNEEKD